MSGEKILHRQRIILRGRSLFPSWWFFGWVGECGTSARVGAIELDARSDYACARMRSEVGSDFFAGGLGGGGWTGTPAVMSSIRWRLTRAQYFV